MKVLYNVLGKASFFKCVGDMFDDRGSLWRGLQNDGVASKESRDKRVDEDQIRILRALASCLSRVYRLTHVPCKQDQYRPKRSFANKSLETFLCLAIRILQRILTDL